MLGTQEHALQVYVDNAVPLLFRGMLYGNAAVYRSIVHQDVHLTEGFDRLGYRRLPVVSACNIQVHEQRPAARFVDLGFDLLALVLKDVSNHDRGTLLSKQSCLRRALSASGPAYQSNLAFKSHFSTSFNIRTFSIS